MYLWMIISGSTWPMIYRSLRTLRAGCQGYLCCHKLIEACLKRNLTTIHPTWSFSLKVPQFREHVAVIHDWEYFALAAEPYFGHS